MSLKIETGGKIPPKLSCSAAENELIWWYYTTDWRHYDHCTSYKLSLSLSLSLSLALSLYFLYTTVCIPVVVYIESARARSILGEPTNVPVYIKCVSKSMTLLFLR